MDSRLEALFGIPYARGGIDAARDGGLDCAGAVLAALRLIDLEDVADEFEAAMLGRQDAEWIAVPESEAEIGDVVLSTNAQGLHTALVVDLGPTRVLSSVERFNVYTVTLERLTPPFSLYRAPCRSSS